MEDSTRYTPLPGADGEEPLYDRLFAVRGCTAAQLTALALHMEDAGIDYDRIDTDEVPMCKTIVRETAAALRYVTDELTKADPGDSVAQNRLRLYRILLAKWNRKLNEME